MDMMIYRIDMALTGRLTQFPDSQKIFGALIYLYAERYSSDRASQFVSKIRDEQVHLSLSNMLPRGYFPVPQTFLLDQLTKQSAHNSDKQEGKKRYKAIKERSFVKIRDIRSLLADPDRAVNLFPYVEIQTSQQIHAAIDSIRYDLPGLDPNVYSVPEVHVIENNSEENYERMTKFSFYLCADQSPESVELLEALQEAHERKRRFFMGPRASQGFNTFVVESLHSESLDSAEQTNTFLNMGMLLPQDIDFAQSSLKLFTSERRPYDPEGGWETNTARKFISFIDAGSIIYTSQGRKKAGCSIPSPFHRSRDIVFGNAFLWPIELDRGERHDGTAIS